MIKDGMMRFVLVSVMVLLVGSFCTAQLRPVPIEKVDSSMNEQAKSLIILLSTEWCKFCQMQKSQLRKNKDFLNKADNFYYVEFNAESKGNIRFHGQDYHFKANGTSTGIHGLAVALNGSDRIAFPTWVLLDKDYKVLFRYNGVLSPKHLDELMSAVDEMKNYRIQKE